MTKNAIRVVTGVETFEHTVETSEFLVEGKYYNERGDKEKALGRRIWRKTEGSQTERLTDCD